MAPQLTLATILRTVCAHYYISRKLVRSQSRCHQTVRVRHIAIYMMRRLHHASLMVISRQVGDRHHTTIMYACRRVKEEMERNEKFRREVSVLESTIRAMKGAS